MRFTNIQALRAVIALSSSVAIAIAGASCSSSPSDNGGTDDGGTTDDGSIDAPVIRHDAHVPPLVDAGIDSNTPDIDANTPPVDANMPPVDANLPDTNMPVDGNAPDTNMPVDANMPDTNMPVDANMPDAAPACDPVAQTGCPAADECSLGQGNVPGCFPNGTVGDGQLCGGAAGNCSRGGICVGNGTIDSCADFCAIDGDCKQPAVPSGTTPEPGNVGRCVFTLTGTPYSLCSFACNPVPKAGAAGCPTGYGCYFGATMTIPELTYCNLPAMGEIPVDGDCTAATAPCAPGSECIGTAAKATCRASCRTGTSGDCSVAGDTCHGVGSQTMFGVCCPAAGC